MLGVPGSIPGRVVTLYSGIHYTKGTPTRFSHRAPTARSATTVGAFRLGLHRSVFQYLTGKCDQVLSLSEGFTPCRHLRSSSGREHVYIQAYNLFSPVMMIT